MDPITAVQIGTGVSTHAALLIQGAVWLYRKSTSPQPITNYRTDKLYQDKKRYDRLCHLRKQLSIDGKIPKEWELDDKDCPIYQSNFAENAGQLKDSVNELNACTYPQKHMVVGLVSIIENLFESLYDKQSIFHMGPLKWRRYRSDGYEAMFFSDLALWLSVDLPRYDIKDPKTESLLKSWIGYCDEVQKEIIIYRNDENSADCPKIKLDFLIADLRRLCHNISKANKAASFNDRILQISSHFLDMGKNLSHLFHLLLQEVQRSEIQVRQFLMHYENTPNMIIDRNMNKLTKYLMGQWIAETFKIAGITSNDFENTLPIDIETIYTHISTDFSRVRLSQTGLWEFARRDRKKAEKYLAQIANLHHLLLTIYHVRDSIVLGAKVSRGLGEAWVYGEDTEEEIIIILLMVIANASDKFSQGVDNFWSEFYRTDYAPYAKGKDNTDDCYRYLSDADKVVSKIKESHLSIIEQIKNIQAEKHEYSGNNPSIENQIAQLTKSLRSYVSITEMPITPSQAEFLFTQNTPPPSMPKAIKRTLYLTEKDELIQERITEITFSETDIPSYFQVAKLLNSAPEQPLEPELASRMTCTLVINPNIDFRSKIQKDIYDNYLVPNCGVVTRPEWISLFLLGSVSRDKISAFKDLYKRVNAVIGMLHSEHCSLLKMRIDPTRQGSFEIVRSLLNEENAIIQFNGELFYANQQTKEIKKIEVTDDNRAIFNQLQLKFVNDYKLADKSELELITSITGLTHMKPMQMIEVTLIDMLLYKFIQQNFSIHQYYPYSGLWQEPPIEAMVDGNLVKVTLHENWLKFARVSLAKELAILTDELKKKEDIIEQLIAEREELVVLLEDRDRRIAIQENELLATKDELAIKDNTIVEQSCSIAEQSYSITKMHNVISEQSDLIADERLKNTELKSALESSQSKIVQLTSIGGIRHSSFFESAANQVITVRDNPRSASALSNS